MKRPIQKNYYCEKCTRLFFGNPFVYGPGTGLSKKDYVVKRLCSVCKDELKPLKSGKPRKPNRVKDLAKIKREEYSKRPKSDLICEKCGTEFCGKPMSLTKKVNHNIISIDVCLCHECQKEYLQNPEILNNI